MNTKEERGEQRYVDILSNGGFKAFFGDESNKEAVMALLNTMLPMHRQIKEIDYQPTEHQGPVIGQSKEFKYDFMCSDVGREVHRGDAEIQREVVVQAMRQLCEPGI